MIYIIVRHSREYDDRIAVPVSYSSNKELAEATAFRLNEQKRILTNSINQIKKLDESFYECIDMFNYVVKEVKEIENEYIEIEYDTKE